MQEQTYPPQRPDPAPIAGMDDDQAREESRQQLQHMLDEYRSRFVLRRDTRGENLSGSVYEGG